MNVQYVVERVKDAIECLNDASPIRAAKILDELTDYCGENADDEFLCSDAYIDLLEALGMADDGECSPTVSVLEHVLDCLE